MFSRIVEQLLKVILKVTDFERMIIFTEVKGIVNSRPLTAISDDVADLEALTPNHFLIGRSNLSLSPNIVYKTDVTSSKRWKHVQYMISNFWRRWRREYLSTLTERRKWVKNNKNLAVGNLVQVVDRNLPRGRWKLGRIMETFPGRDDIVRVVDVKTCDGVIRRPVTKLCCLEDVAIE